MAEIEPVRRLPLSEIEARLCDIAADVTGVRRNIVHPGSRMLKDLHCDSLMFLDLLFRIEDSFGLSLPDDSDDLAYKAVFTREDLRLSDVAELLYLQQGRERPIKRKFFGKADVGPIKHIIPFTQLGGVLTDRHAHGPLLEILGKNKCGYPVHRRLTDGMMCVEIPAADISIGTNDPNAMPDERPSRCVQLKGFLIDQEPVSTTAYCRFLNSIGSVDRSTLEAWFILAPDDKRQVHELLKHGPHGWQPLAGTERMPMILVSWFGADAYSCWANRSDWRNPSDEQTYLPSDAQWEYAARGREPQKYPWGNGEPTTERARFGMHVPHRTYQPDQLPMADVNAELGMSPFGLHHMAGNVWQWCRDWYAPNVRSERGGSWVGPAFLCRSSYRRGRIPSAKGRCLGFRCVSEIPASGSRH